MGDLERPEIRMACDLDSKEICMAYDLTTNDLDGQQPRRRAILPAGDLDIKASHLDGVRVWLVAEIGETVGVGVVRKDERMREKVLEGGRV